MKNQERQYRAKPAAVVSLTKKTNKQKANTFNEFRCGTYKNLLNFNYIASVLIQRKRWNLRILACGSHSQLNVTPKA